MEFINVLGSTVTGDRHELICGKGSTTVSKQKQQPEPLTVAILQLDPSMLHTPNRSFSSQ